MQDVTQPSASKTNDSAEYKVITIPACDEHEGIYALTVSVPWHCIRCGEQRGEPFETISYDGSRRLAVTGWRNPCGHVEYYGAVREWVKAQAKGGTQ